VTVDYKVFGKQIAKRRKVLNLTQEEIADKAGVTTTHVRNIERAHTRCSIDVMCRLCTALEVTPDYLFLGALKSADEDLMATVTASLRLCDKKQLKLVAALIACVVDESSSP
jgi:transcriptional regulator with XRE-family HTH domain